jgi:tRNA G18 (ribose-2'-O)-methylase SpoU
MAAIEIREPDDPRLADYRALARPGSIRAQGLFVAEGRLVVERLLADSRYVVRSMLLSRAAHAALERSLATLAANVPVYVCRVDQFLDVTGFNLHRGCLALVERPGETPLERILGAADLVVVLEEVANADNIGGVFRNVDAFGAGGVLLTPGCCDPFYRKAVRTSMAATLRVPFARLERWPSELAALRAAGFALIALTPRAPALTLDEFARRKPDRVALIVGAEGAGLTPGTEAAADYRVRIPVRPEVDSLNLSVAAGIALSRLASLSRLTNFVDLE